ncbi:MAG: hypothetical protein OXS29_01420 [bacterium]|nr:hypothetical protein [bacterium]MDE0287178.1 hypothetical protein [bacterium]MDE0437167.1 hypothetical protein [bacterium]
MSPGVAAAIGFLFLAALLLGVVVVVFREAGRRGRPEPPVYVVNDAVEFALASLDPELVERIGKAGVRRIIEWSTHYLQGLAVPSRRRKGLRVVAGGEGAAIEYIQNELVRRGHDYPTADIAQVLAAEAGYLAGIGALGERVSEEEPV